MEKRIKLKQYRVGLDISQQEMSDRLGVSRTQYVLIENGHRHGTLHFWQRMQDTFGIPDSDMWGMMK